MLVLVSEPPRLLIGRFSGCDHGLQAASLSWKIHPHTLLVGQGFAVRSLSLARTQLCETPVSHGTGRGGGKRLGAGPGAFCGSASQEVRNEPCHFPLAWICAEAGKKEACKQASLQASKQTSKHPKTPLKHPKQPEANPPYPPPTPILNQP